MNSRLTDSQAKLLNLEEKGRQWEVDIQLLRNSEAELKAILLAKSKDNKVNNSNLLRNSRVEIKALKAQINNLQKEAIQMEGAGKKGSVVQKLLDDKDKEIQALKKMLKIPGS